MSAPTMDRPLEDRQEKAERLDLPAENQSVTRIAPSLVPDLTFSTDIQVNLRVLLQDHAQAVA